jgi:hypothetical protein
MDSSKAFEGGEHLEANGLKWFVAITQVLVEPKAKKKYKTKKEKEKDTTVEELVFVA